MPDTPIAKNDPIVSKSLAPHYLVAATLLMATLFWALWDEDFGQRPWKSFQHQWKKRYTSFLKQTLSSSSASQSDLQATPDYQALKQAYEKANQAAAPHYNELNAKLRELNAKILAVQNIFTDRRAYVSAATYAIETESSPSSKQRQERNLEKYKQELTTVEYPDGRREKYSYAQLEETYNNLKDERTRTSAELGEVLKPVNEQKEQLDAYISEHMINLTPSQISGLQNK